MVAAERPSGIVADGVDRTTLTVHVLDASGRALPGLTVSFVTTASGDSIAQPVTPTDADGRATGSLGSTRAGTTTVTARVTTPSGLVEVGPIDVTFTAGPPTHLVFGKVPATVVAGVHIVPAVTVSLQDAHWNVATTAKSPVTVALSSTLSGARLAGTLTAAAVGGTATFPDLAIDLVGPAYVLTATSGALTAETVGTIQVVPAPPSRLGFVSVPVAVAPGAPFEVVVAIQDSGGNRVGETTADLTLALQANPGGATLGGAVHVTAKDGLATFAGLTLSAAGEGYTIYASSPGLEGAASAPITVLPIRVVSGKLTYDHVPATLLGLDYGAKKPWPIRGAVVELLDAADESVLAESLSGADGGYSMKYAGPAKVRLRVTCRTVVPMIQVEDNTDGNAVFALESSTFDASKSPEKDLHAAVGWSGKYVGTRAAAPFAILDAAYQASHTFLDVTDVSFPPLHMNWSEINTTCWDFALAEEVNIKQGCILSTHFNPKDGEIYIKGLANVNTDEFDSHVVVHEWGHFLQEMLGRADGLGGSHAIGDVLDPRIAFTEGWGTALSAMVLFPDVMYVNTEGPSQGDGWGMDLEDPGWMDYWPGYWSEMSVQSILFDLFDEANESWDTVALGVLPLYQSMTGHHKDTDALATLFSFVTGLKELHPEATSAIDKLLAHYDIDPIVDDFATGETHWGDYKDNLPMYKWAEVDGEPIDVVLHKEAPQNALGGNRFVLFEGTGELTGVWTPGGTWVWLSIFDHGKLLAEGGAAEGGGVNTKTEAGKIYVIDVQDFWSGLGKYTSEVHVTTFSKSVQAPITLTAALRPGSANLVLSFPRGGTDIAVHVYGTDGLRVDAAPMLARSVAAGGALRLEARHEGASPGAVLAVQVRGHFGGLRMSEVFALRVAGAPRRPSRAMVDRRGRWIIPLREGE